MTSRVCLDCGTPSRGFSRAGSTLLELALWVLFFPVGIVYSLWRMTSGARRCRACRGRRLVPASTPFGRAAAGRA